MITSSSQIFYACSFFFLILPSPDLPRDWSDSTESNARTNKMISMESSNFHVFYAAVHTSLFIFLDTGQLLLDQPIAARTAPTNKRSP
jgi:hypothetical protein